MRVAKCKKIFCVGHRRDDPVCERKSNKLFLFSLVTILSIGDLPTSSAQTSLESGPAVGIPPINVKINSAQDSRRTFPASVSILAQPPAVSSARVLENPGVGQKQRQAKEAAGENGQSSPAVNQNQKSVLNSKATENVQNWLRFRRSAAEKSAAAPTMATTTADSRKIGEFGDPFQVHNKMMVKRNSENGGDENYENDGGRRDANLMRLLSQLIAAKQKMQHNNHPNQHGGDSFTSNFGGFDGHRITPELGYNHNNNHQPTEMEEYEEEDEAEDDQPMVLSISNINQIPPSERTKILRVAGTGHPRGGVLSGSFRSPSASDFAVEVADPIPLFASQHHLLQSGGKLSRGMLRMRRRAMMRNPGYEMMPINEPTFFMVSSERASRFRTPSM